MLHPKHGTTTPNWNVSTKMPRGLTTDAYVGVVLAKGGTQRGDGAHNLKLLRHDLQQGCEGAAGSWPDQAMP